MYVYVSSIECCGRPLVELSSGFRGAFSDTTAPGSDRTALGGRGGPAVRAAVNQWCHGDGGGAAQVGETHHIIAVVLQHMRRIPEALVSHQRSLDIMEQTYVILYWRLPKAPSV